MKLELPKTFTADPHPNGLDLLIGEAGLNLQTTAAKEFIKIALENALLMDKKQQDYGSRNISDFHTIGVVVRMNDKMQRIKNIMGKGKRKKAQNESIIDSFRDLSNYAIIAILLEKKLWPDQ